LNDVTVYSYIPVKKKNVTFRPNGAISISVGQRPTNRIPLENKALKGRKPNEDNHFQNKITLLLSPLQGVDIFIFVT
jgi:hypothetical protein